jgi:hypothetical protein
MPLESRSLARCESGWNVQEEREGEGGSKSRDRLRGRWRWTTLPGRDEGVKAERDGRTV